MILRPETLVVTFLAATWLALSEPVTGAVPAAAAEPSSTADDRAATAQRRAVGRSFAKRVMAFRFSDFAEWGLVGAPCRTLESLSHTYYPGSAKRVARWSFAETPYSYLMTRRIERAKAVLRRGDLTVTEVCFAVGCTSLGSFSSRFFELVGESPSAYRARSHEHGAAIPACMAKIHTRPVRADVVRHPPPTGASALRRRVEL